MGGIVSRRSPPPEEPDNRTSQAYRYPPKNGCYFGSSFLMGGKKFDSTQPDAFLFGENSDLNYLSGRPCQYTLPSPDAKEPSRTLCSLVNIRKDSLRFVKALDAMGLRDKNDKDEPKDPSTISPKYNIEFTFDTDVNIAITIYYQAKEEINGKEVKYISQDASMNSETYHYQKGAGQTFVQTSHVVDPSQFSEEEWQFNVEKECFPIVIQCVVEDPEHLGHSHTTLAAIDKFSDYSHCLKPLKQKQMVEGMYFLLQEIYGIENKNHERAKLDDDYDDYGLECVICMCDVRDTLILPCRHLCLCHVCADDLRFQASNCPICRSPFRALLQINALKKIDTKVKRQSSQNSSMSQEGVPPGYEAVSLMDALNGPPLNGERNDSSLQSNKKKHRKSSSTRSSRRSKRSIGDIVVVDRTLEGQPQTSSLRRNRGQAEKRLVQSPVLPESGDGPSPGETNSSSRPAVEVGAVSPTEEPSQALPMTVIRAPPSPPHSLPQKLNVRDAATCTSGDSPGPSVTVSLNLEDSEDEPVPGPEAGSIAVEIPEGGASSESASSYGSACSQQDLLQGQEREGGNGEDETCALSPD